MAVGEFVRAGGCRPGHAALRRGRSCRGSAGLEALANLMPARRRSPWSERSRPSRSGSAVRELEQRPAPRGREAAIAGRRGIDRLRARNRLRRGGGRGAVVGRPLGGRARRRTAARRVRPFESENRFLAEIRVRAQPPAGVLRAGARGAGPGGAALFPNTPYGVSVWGCSCWIKYAHHGRCGRRGCCRRTMSRPAPWRTACPGCRCSSGIGGRQRGPLWVSARGAPARQRKFGDLGCRRRRTWSATVTPPTPSWRGRSRLPALCSRAARLR